MSSKPKFTSPKIAEKMAKAFGNKAKTVVVDMIYRKEVGDFLLKIEQAHKGAGKSRRMYKSMS
jgi:hypothetical protein